MTGSSSAGVGHMRAMTEAELRRAGLTGAQMLAYWQRLEDESDDPSRTASFSRRMESRRHEACHASNVPGARRSWLQFSTRRATTWVSSI